MSFLLLLLTVLARCPGTVGTLLEAAFLAANTGHALCHSWSAAFSNCLFSTTLSSISLLTASLQTENANKGFRPCQISVTHKTPGTAQREVQYAGRVPNETKFKETIEPKSEKKNSFQSIICNCLSVKPIFVFFYVFVFYLTSFPRRTCLCYSEG